MGELEGKVAVITGAGSGMGRAAARAFVREGAKVLGVGRSETVEVTAKELGASFVAFRGDVTIEADIEAAMAAAVGSFGRLDAVLNVAGSGGSGPLAELDAAEYERVLAVNMRSVMLGTKHAIRMFLAGGHGGVVLNWSSSAGMNAPTMPISAYCAAKAGAIALTKSAAVEYGSEGIRANAIVPGGVILTEMVGGPERVAALRGLIDAVPLKRPCQPEEVAELASFLASDRATYINGAIIPIDGGQTAVLVS